MKLSDFNFDLPDERIARFPAANRRDSKLMVVNRLSGEISHHTFSDLPDLISDNDFIVMNNTRVDPVRIFANFRGKRIEFLIIKKNSEYIAEVFALPAKKLKVGTKIEFGDEIEGYIKSVGERGRRTIRFNYPLNEVLAAGYAPLPPYIKRKYHEADQHREFDLERYQTVYSKNSGSIAAPTAGLHFDGSLLEEISSKIELLEVNLSVGPATFQKIEVDDIDQHKMGEEKVEIQNGVAEKIKLLKSENKELIAVGTTTVRSLETYALNNPENEEFTSRLFISPGFEFKLVDKMITNFHLPESSLFILVCSFAGLELMKKAYKTAIENRYNFFSYGDAMFII